jgi:hypothetical protein
MTNSKPVRGAFGTGEIPTIACFNKAITPLGVDLDALIAAMQSYVTNFVEPVWSTGAKLIQSSDFVKGAWAIVFLDDADTDGALAYHDLTPDGWPLAKVFVRTTLANGDQVSVSASHELVEMLVDPAINMMTTGPDPTIMYAYESADPVEALSFSVNDIPMSDFVFPSYFEVFREPGSTHFDQLNQVTKPFEILKGGYQITFKNGKWDQVFGSAEKKKLFALEDRRGHRSETRINRKKLQRANLEEIADLQGNSRFRNATSVGVSN